MGKAISSRWALQPVPAFQKANKDAQNSNNAGFLVHRSVPCVPAPGGGREWGNNPPLKEKKANTKSPIRQRGVNMKKKPF